ncbi:hypothetical protein BTZ20_4379 [Rhodococcus sp. MTM3W5.2]|uniref:hypothetical protein n=1 Tax=Rhodococcus sp. MTM3W5.2 TaxID=1805827 RepID=UPI0009794C6D|nr:hypothetical protein [Rhodococcus sp. MTM3W5.2]AQA26016.1 hypothetical protein BTZ20_4379 [Rhodococcus sp. MTM3W5.2]
MKRSTRYFAGLLTACALTVGLAGGTAQATQPPGAGTGVQIPGPAVPPAKTVSAGMRITFDDYTREGGSCSLGAVGTDSQNRKIGITAGHCNPWESHRRYIGPGRQVQVLDNTHRVWDWRDVGAGPIGWIRYVSNDDRDGFGALVGTLDYMVIEFADNITLSSQVMTTPKYGPDASGTAFPPNEPYDPGPIEVASVPWFKMNAIYGDAAGNPTDPSVNQTLCNAGTTTTQYFAQSGDAKQVQCGPILGNSNGILTTQAGSKQGDSGGPAFIQGRAPNGPGSPRGSRTSFRTCHGWASTTSTPPPGGSSTI